MFKDYSGSLTLVSGRNKIKYSKNKTSAVPGDFLPATKRMWHTVGAMLLVTLVIGISSTVWYGLQVQVALDQIGRDTGINKELLNENRLLVAQRDLMLTQGHMEEAGQKHGLRFPTKNQLRYP